MDKPLIVAIAGRLWIVWLVAIMALLHVPATLAEQSPIALRVQNAVGKFTQMRAAAVVYPVESKAWFGSDRLELSVGSLISDTDEASMVSIGPVWHFPFARNRAFIELGFAPTLLSHSNFEVRDLGGRFHFTSSIEVGRYFGRGNPLGLSLRLQHTSNGGIENVNPGFDMVGVNISFDF